MEKHEQVIAVAHGSVDKHIVTCEDLLGAKIGGVMKLARAFGIKEGMDCRKAVNLLS